MLTIIYKNQRPLFFLFCGLIFAGLFYSLPSQPRVEIWSSYSHFFLIGIFAATVANSTGAGGGIVFLPAFMALGLTPVEALATSLAIQCFGMTSGALSWLSHQKLETKTFGAQWRSFSSIIMIAVASSCIGIIATQQLMPTAPMDVELLFSIFSFCVGFIILHRTLKLDVELPGRETPLSKNESIFLALCCLIGGALTSWLSIAIGEILAILLIFMGFRVNLAIAAAVCVTSVSVICALPFHLLETRAVNLEVLLFAAPGALIGGALARRLAIYLGAHRLKIMMACWIILSALAYFR